MMIGKKQLLLATLSLVVGLVAGAMIGAPADGLSPPIADAEKTKLTALEKDPTASIADEIVAMMPANLWGTGGGSVAAWTEISNMDLAGVTKLARHLDGRDWLSAADARVLELAMEHWGQLDPSGALDWIETISRSGVAQAAHGRAFAALASGDLEAALERLDTMPEKFRRSAPLSLAEPFARADPARAAQFYIDRETSSVWQHRKVASVWAESDPLAAISFYAGKDTGENLTKRIVGQWGKTDPEGALGWAQEQDVDQATRNSYVSAISSSMMAGDPVAAMAILDEIPAGVARNNAISTMIASWARTDPAAAAAWARELHDPAALARATMKISQTVRVSDPALALELAETLPNAEFRQEAFESFAENNAKKDPDAGLAWAEALDDEDRRRSAITNSIAGIATVDLTRAIDYFVETGDQTHKKEMLHKIISNNDVSQGQLNEAREVIDKLSKEDERLAIDTILEVNGEHLPKPLKALIKVTGDLGTFMDWAEKMDGGY